MREVKFILREVKLKYIDRRDIVICLKDDKTGLTIPHPINEFINLKYNSSKVSLNTQRLVGNIICQYLNFLSEKVKYNEQYNDLKFMGFKGLNIDYGLDFINSKKRLGLSKDYIDLIIYYLSDFYLYLNDSKITSLNLDTKLSEGSIKRSNIFGI